MVKFALLLFLLAVFPLTLSLPQGHIQSTFDINSGHNCEPSLRLIKTSEEKPPEWMNEGGILNLIRNNIKFMDVTDHLDLGTRYKYFSRREYPVQPSFSGEVKSLIGNLTTKFMRANLETFSSFHNRYYRSSYGAQSSNWLYNHIFDIIESANDAGLSVDVSVRKFTHSWGQNSIIARFEGHDADKGNEVVIVGAHQDSINMWMPQYGRAPGADDDGSGTVTILEAFRVLVFGEFKPQRPVEFHWYSGEEAGLLGSQAVASEYERQGKDVIGMLQNDMTGYIGKNGEVMGIVTDYVSEPLTVFLKKLIRAYSALSYRDSKCGYACSDHASWTKAGYPSAFAIESDFGDSNPNIHSTNDIIAHLSFDHMLEFSKLCVSFAVELSHA